MRLFVALVPPPEAVSELRAAVDMVRVRHPGLRWTAPDSWHVTLAFLGTVDAATRTCLEDRLARVASRHPPPVLALAGGGRFGDSTLWVGLAGDRRELSALANGVRRAAGKCRIPVEDRPWHGHVTLARAGRRGRGHGSGAESALAGPSAELAAHRGTAWTAEQMHLVRSVIGEGPPHYHDVAAWTLAGRPAARLPKH